jgi:hypothetical protein
MVVEKFVGGGVVVLVWASGGVTCHQDDVTTGEKGEKQKLLYCGHYSTSYGILPRRKGLCPVEYQIFHGDESIAPRPNHVKNKKCGH